MDFFDSDLVDLDAMLRSGRSIVAERDAIALPAAPRGVVPHATWVTTPGTATLQLAIWAEAQTPPQRRRASTAVPRGTDGIPLARAHPFAAKHAELALLTERLWRIARPGVRPRTTAEEARLTLWLPTTGNRPYPSPELIAAEWATADTAAVPWLTLWRVPALLLDAESAGLLLMGLPTGEDAAALAPTAAHTHAAHAQSGPLLPIGRPGADLRLWSAAASLAHDMLVRQQYLPGAAVLAPEHALGGYGSGPRVASTWRGALGEPAVRSRFDALAAAMPDLCRAAVTLSPASRVNGSVSEPPPVARDLLEAVLHTIINARVERFISRSELTLMLPPHTRMRGVAPSSSHYGFNAYYDSLTSRWLQGLRTPNRLLHLTNAEAQSLLTGLQRWHAGLGQASTPVFRLCFRLTPPPALEPEAPAAHAVEATNATEATSDALLPATTPAPDAPLAALDLAGVGDAWQLDYLVQGRDDPSLLVPLEEIWRERSQTMALMGYTVQHPHEHVLAGLGQAARLSAPIERSLHEAHPTGCALTGEEALAFLRQSLPRLQEEGFGVLVPGWWRRVPAKPSLRLRLRGVEKTSTGLMGLDAVVAFDWKVALGGAELSRAELEQLAALKEPLVRLRGQWVELGQGEVEAALRVMQRHSGGMSLGEALRVSLNGEIGEGASSFVLEEVQADAWLDDLFQRLRQSDAVSEVSTPPDFHGTLRPYQVRGLGWLDFLGRYGLGACLADDMGLGKSIELLALLLHAKAQGRLTQPVLLVCPTSVVGNWQHEAARFAPSLRVLVHHGAGRTARTNATHFADEVAHYDLVLTSYSLLPRDEATLAAMAWGAVVLDEAQNIKNVEAKQSRSARRLRAPVRIALTGTPVENRLAELWSIMDFLNAGYLGSYKHFHERFAARIEQDHDKDAVTQLQTLVRPFVLRRLKSDPNVIRDLPEKIEMREYCPLTREQVTLYEAVVRDGLRQIESADSPMQRRGVVLALLSKLKQVCNHPAHFLGDASPLHGRSGKLARLEELIEELLAEGDRALIFTQFTAMGDRLRPYLAKRFGVDVLYLHGGVPQRERMQLVERFQAPDGPPLFLLSLKAGGTGLNLTSANHVIHFDRWWNPAVENQATDRAFRIGQTRNVQVRKFVCSGTLEERIDAMIEQKRDLAEQVIGTGEGWLTELSTVQLRDLLTLRATALVTP